MKPITSILLVSALAFGINASAQSVHNGSQASALSAAGLSAAVAFVPLSVVIGGSALSLMTLDHLSRLLSEQTEWMVDQVTGKGPQTELKLRAKQRPDTVMVVGVPTTQVINNGVVVNNQVHFDKLGTNSFALKQGEKTIGVMSGDNHTGHSVKK